MITIKHRRLMKDVYLSEGNARRAVSMMLKNGGDYFYVYLGDGDFGVWETNKRMGITEESLLK